MDTWTKIDGFEAYEVSRNGNIRNCNTGKVLKPTLNTWGYPSVTLCANGKRKNVPVHRIVAMAFIPNPNGFPEVNHLDENKEHNAVSNLEWATKKANINYGTRTARANEKKFKCVAQFSLNGTFLRLWNSVKEAEQTGFNHSAISACCHGRRKSHGGFVWRYVV